jgi:hypothetical protein
VSRDTTLDLPFSAGQSLISPRMYSIARRRFSASSVLS